jgi:hypothetical protein
MNFPNQAAVAQLVHLIDERHQQRLADLLHDDLQDAILIGSGSADGFDFS